MFTALVGLVLVVVGLWMAWPPLGVIGAGLFLCVVGSELGDREQDVPVEVPDEMNWG